MDYIDSTKNICKFSVYRTWDFKSGQRKDNACLKWCQNNVLVIYKINFYIPTHSLFKYKFEITQIFKFFKKQT